MAKEQPRTHVLGDDLLAARRAEIALKQAHVQLEVAQLGYDEVIGKIMAFYQLEQGDMFDRSSGKITRKPPAELADADRQPTEAPESDEHNRD